MAADFDVELNATDVPSTAASLARALRDADAVLCTITDPLPATLLAARPRRARILANFGVGHGHIDLAAARAAGLVVTNTPGVLTSDTADLTMTLLLSTARRAGEGERMVRSGSWSGWRPTQLLGTRVTGKTLGIVGFGRIGRAVAQRARLGFGMRILVWSPSLARAAATGEALNLGPDVVCSSSLDQLLAASDFVSLHCPANADTRHLINAARLARLRPHAILVNTSRGDVVDERALVQALAAGRIAGAGLDVYEHEPALSAELLAMERVVLLPHIGSATVETRGAMGERAVANLRAFFRGEEPPDRVV